MAEKKLAEPGAPGWTFLSNYGHVLVLLATDAEMTLREVSDRVGITERAVQRIVADLEAANYLERERTGRRNRYKVFQDMPLRHAIESHRTIGELLGLFMKRADQSDASDVDQPADSA